MTNKPSTAIIIPVLHEATNISSALERLHQDFPNCELIVVDGGSSDETASLARKYARVITSMPGRARQMNCGAAATTSDVLWFVHADVEIQPNSLDQIYKALEDHEVVGGGLSLRFNRKTLGLNYLAWSSNLRAKYLHWIFGDQSMFVRHTTFNSLGGFPKVEIFEDMEMSRSLHKSGKLALLSATSTASSRRFDLHGTWSMILFMQYLKIEYFLGVDTGKIRSQYQKGPSIIVPKWLKTLSLKPNQLTKRTLAGIEKVEDHHENSFSN